MTSVLITGGAGGIGTAISEKFIDEGYFVYILDFDSVASRKLMDRYGSDKCAIIHLDVTDTNAIKKCVLSLDDSFSINHIVTLAGRAMEGEWKPFEKQELQIIEDSIKVNLLGHINIIHAFLPYLKKAEGDKSVTMISSINAMTGFNLPAYSAAKAGLYGFVNGIVHEFGQAGIRINTVSPGTVRTAATLSEPKDFNQLLETTALGKFATVEDVAKMVYAICNDFVSVTGQDFVIDAGQLKVH